MSSLAQEESRSISENCTWGQRKRFADGKVTVPFKRFLGYDRGPDGNLVLNPDEAVTVRRIYSMFLQGMTPHGIAARLTADSINRIPVRQVENLPAEVTYPINKLLLTGDPADMPHVEELMQQEFAGKLSICRSQPFFIETMPLGVGKDTSLEILLRAKGLTPANLMACGDGWNDLPMIRLAGLGVAMGNAQAPVKAAADWLTADNDHDGVGLAVEKFILEEN